MHPFEVGDLVQVTGATMTGDVGTVVYVDEQRQRCLVRIDAVTQNFFAEDDLEPFQI